jgi:hypothetical protein
VVSQSTQSTVGEDGGLEVAGGWQGQGQQRESVRCSANNAVATDWQVLLVRKSGLVCNR